MGYLNNFMIKTQFNLNNMSSFNVFFFQNLVPFGEFFLVSIYPLFFSLFDIFSEALSWLQCEKISELDNSVPIETEDVTEEKTEETKPDVMESKGEENESPKLFFKFQFQTKTFEEFSKKFKGNECYSVGLDSIPLIPCTSTNKYEFNSGNDLSCIIKKPEDSSFCVKELYVDSSNGLLSEQDFIEQNLKEVDSDNVDSTTSSPAKMSDFEVFEDDFAADSSRDIEEEEISGTSNENGASNTSDNSEKPNLENPLAASDCEDSNGLETLWEHQELIEQLKMELKKVKATGLPTILEESDSPIKMDDLKPWKIDEKFQYADRMTELHKFYKSYRERMRKFDILNYQKMYAIGFLHSKDPFQSISSHKSFSAPAISSLLPRNLWPRRLEMLDSDPCRSSSTSFMVIWKWCMWGNCAFLGKYFIGNTRKPLKYGNLILIACVDTDTTK